MFNVGVRYHYGPWGELLYITNGNNADVSSDPTHIANINPIRYREYYYDTETGFYFLNSRYYDPQICRFINADSVIPRRQQRHQYLQVQQIHQTLNILEMIQQNVTFQISNGADLVHRHRDGEIM